MNETVTMIFGLIGGLALFLFGMNNMSSSLQKVAGDRMKKVLGFLTRNPLLGAVAGALVTAVLQSSSATTVMVIGFVSAGLMSLPQAISVIFGANIGTTMTALLVCARQELEGRTAPEKFDELFQGVKSLQEQIVGYISRLFARGVLNEEQSEITAGLLFVTNNIDRITDRCGEITGCVRQLRTGGHSFSPDASRELEECFTISQDLFNTAMDAIRRGDRHAAQEVLLEKNQMREQQKKYNRSHLERVTRKECDAALTPDYTGILYGLDRITDNCVSIAEEALDQISFVALEQPMVLAGEVEP